MTPRTSAWGQPLIPQADGVGEHGEDHHGEDREDDHRAAVAHPQRPVRRAQIGPLVLGPVAAGHVRHLVLLVGFMTGYIAGGLGQGARRHTASGSAPWRRLPPRGGVSAAYSRLRMAREGEQGASRTRRRLAEAARAARARAAPDEPRAPGRRRAGAMDVFGGEIRRRDVFPLLVLHLISREPAYGNRLIEEIEAITDGVISVNPNTIYPLLARPGGARPDRGPVGASGPANAPLLLDHGGRAQGVPAAGRRARAVPRLGDRVRDPDQA